MAGNDRESEGTVRVPRGAKHETALHLRVYGDVNVTAHRVPDTGKLDIGRASTNDVVVDDVSISRQHAILHVGARIELEDLGSANGTTVRQRALVPGARTVISIGEPFGLGALSAVIQLGPIGDAPAESRRAPPPASTIFPTDGPMQALRATVERLAVGTISVLLLGETGVGKEILAEQVHFASRRTGKPFLRINCGALSETLLETELFGHEKGAFTGAAQTKVGLLESANGGSVFLDEVGELPPGLQVKLLRVLENREVLRVGALRPRPLDVRFIAATNRDLERAVRDGTFREDLYFRLGAATVAVPPLRERVSEIEPLTELFLARASGELGRRTPRLADDARETLLRYSWPGNVRELRNALERAVLLCDDVVEARHMPARLLEGRPTPTTPRLLRDDIDEIERNRIVEALGQCAGSQSAAARVLGVSRSTLLARIDQHGIPRPRKKS